MTSSTSTTWCAIVNPAAGGGRAGKRALAALSRLSERGVRFTSLFTRAPGNAVDIARDRALRGDRHFLCVGGDGTTHEVLNGALSALEGSERITLAMLPLGTGNSFLRDFGVFDEHEAEHRLVRGRTKSIDLLRVVHEAGELFAINLVGLGFAAAAGALTNRRYKPLGALGYVLAVLETAAKLPIESHPFSTDRAPRDDRPAILLSFSNSRATGGGMLMAPSAEVDDGELDVIRIGPMPRRRFLAAFPRIFSGRHVELDGVEQSRAREVLFVARPGQVGCEVDCMIDGEVVPLVLRSIEVTPRAVDVVV